MCIGNETTRLCFLPFHREEEEREDARVERERKELEKK